MQVTKKTKKSMYWYNVARQNVYKLQTIFWYNVNHQNVVLTCRLDIVDCATFIDCSLSKFLSCRAVFLSDSVLALDCARSMISSLSAVAGIRRRRSAITLSRATRACSNSRLCFSTSSFLWNKWTTQTHDRLQQSSNHTSKGPITVWTHFHVLAPEKNKIEETFGIERSVCIGNIR